MTEAWFLIDEPSIRLAAGNPRGSQQLNLPSIRLLEQIADPKASLQECLRRASGYNGRRLAGFDIRQAYHRHASSIKNFAPLRALESFSNFEQEFGEAVRALCLGD